MVCYCAYSTVAVCAVIFSVTDFKSSGILQGLNEPLQNVGESLCLTQKLRKLQTLQKDVSACPIVQSLWMTFTWTTFTWMTFTWKVHMPCTISSTGSRFGLNMKRCMEV